MEAPAREPEGRTCGECKTHNGLEARYCKACGASLVAPPECPACKAAVPRDAKFCSGCGIKLVGPRPSRASTAQPATAAAVTATPTSAPSVTAKVDDAKREVEQLTATMPRAKPRSSNIVGNVLLFIAALSIFVVVMYAVNKNAPKEVSPFMGGPAPNMGGAPQAEQPAQPQIAQSAPSAGAAAQPAQAAAGTGGPIRGTIKLDPSIAASAPQNATIFVIARNQGMPNMGPPVAVRKIDNPRFPQEFELAPGDAMQPGTFIGPFDLYVRLDADGNAMTKAPGDFHVNAPKSGISPGATGVEIVLDKRL